MKAAPRILIVDDETAYAEMVREMARMSDAFGAAALDVAASYEQALAALQNRTYDVALFDYFLGARDGLMLLRDVRERGIDTAVVVLTGHGAENVAVEAMKAGAVDYLNKAQLTSDTLESALRHAIALREEERQRKSVEAALRTSEERFRALVENSSDALLLIDAVGRLTYVAASTLRHFGWEAGRISGTSLLEMIHPDDRPIATMRIGDALRHPGDPVTQEIRVRHGDGDWRIVEAIVVNRLADPSVGAIVINARDLTDRRTLEDALRQSQKLEAVGQLAGGVAHDFNNLLTAILGYCNLMLEELPKEHALRSDLEEIRVAGERAAALTRQLLAFSRRQMLQPQVVDVNELVGQLERLVKRMAGDSVEVSIVLAPGLMPVRVDPSSIEQVIINLAMNGKDAMPNGGRLILRTENIEIGDTAENRSMQNGPPPGPYVRLGVCDTGAGMDEATRRHIFEPFFTTRQQGRGRSLGLGLATVYGIVKQNNGYIFVTSGVASGTTFNLYLHPFLSRTAAVPEGRAWQTVLLVDEDDAMRALAREELRREGYVVLEAKHAADALRIAERHPDEIHVLLTSLSLPHMSGRDLASRLSTERPRLKRILAAPTTESLTNQEIADGAFLRRPYAPDALLSSVRRLLRADSHQP